MPHLCMLLTAEDAKRSYDSTSVSIGQICYQNRPAMAREAHDYRLKPRAVAATFHYFALRALKMDRDVLD